MPKEIASNRLKKNWKISSSVKRHSVIKFWKILNNSLIKLSAEGVHKYIKYGVKLENLFFNNWTWRTCKRWRTILLFKSSLLICFYFFKLRKIWIESGIEQKNNRRMKWMAILIPSPICICIWACGMNNNKSFSIVT